MIHAPYEPYAPGGIGVTGRSRQLTAEDLQRFDYVIARDAENLADIRALQKATGRSARVHRLRDWDPKPNGRDAPDPYVTGQLRGFEEVHDVEERSCAGLLDHLLRSACF